MVIPFSKNSLTRKKPNNEIRYFRVFSYAFLQSLLVMNFVKLLF